MIVCSVIAQEISVNPRQMFNFVFTAQVHLSFVSRLAQDPIVIVSPDSRWKRMPGLGREKDLVISPIPNAARKVIAFIH